MANEVFDDRRVCDNCEKVFLLSDETTENIEGKCNPEIHEETYEGIYCWKCINSIEEKIMDEKLTGNQYTYSVSVMVKTKDTDLTIEDAVETLNLSESDYSGLMDKLDNYVINKGWEEDPNTNYG
jgi:hypothetical protein